MAQTFFPLATPNAIALINAASEDTVFIMKQFQPASMWNPEDMDLVPHQIHFSGTYEECEKKWDSLMNRVQMYHDKEKWEIFSKCKGDNFSNVVFFKGGEVITLTICTKNKAKELAL